MDSISFNHLPSHFLLSNSDGMENLPCSLLNTQTIEWNLHSAHFHYVSFNSWYPKTIPLFASIKLEWSREKLSDMDLIPFHHSPSHFFLSDLDDMWNLPCSVLFTQTIEWNLHSALIHYALFISSYPKIVPLLVYFSKSKGVHGIPSCIRDTVTPQIWSWIA